MIRDFTALDWMDTILRPREKEVEKLRSHLGYMRKQAYYEGLTRHLRPGEQGRPEYECPFCSDMVNDLPNHLILCEEVPGELRQPL